MPFIPLLESTGAIVTVGISIFEQAYHQLVNLHRQGLDALTVSVNLSTRQLSSPT